MSNKWKVKEVDISEIEPTEVNANVMADSDFNKLTENIKKSGLSSLIACYKRDDGKFIIISGNHRYKACVKLGYSKLNILYAEEADLTNDEMIAVQLSHNSLHGSDDKNILKRLLDEISTIEYKEFAHISIDDIKIEDGMFSGNFTPMAEHFTVSLVLYKKDIELIQELLDISKENLLSSDVVILADGGAENEFLSQIAKVRKEFDIKSTSIAFSKILELAKIGLLNYKE